MQLPTARATAGTRLQDLSLTLLRGKAYQADRFRRQVGALEYSAASSRGDLFFLADHLLVDDGDSANYAELSPRIRLAKTDSGPISGAYLAGVGIDLADPPIRVWIMSTDATHAACGASPRANRTCC